MLLMQATGIRRQSLSTFTTDASGQLDVFWHNGDTFGVDGTQIGVFKKANQVRFGCFLQGKNSGTLESQVRFEVLGDFTYKALKGKLADQQVSGLLLLSDFTKGYGSWPVSVRFLYTTGSWGGFTGSFGRQLFAWCLATSGFTCGLLGTGHVWLLGKVVSANVRRFGSRATCNCSLGTIEKNREVFKLTFLEML